jgi:hypothetical protein
MRQPRKIQWRRAFVLLVLLVYAATWATGRVLNLQDRSKVAKITEKMKTLCVGRFLIDIPAEAEVRFTHETIGGFDIETVEESDVEFHERIASRQAEIMARAPATDGTGGMLRTRILQAQSVIGRVFAFGLNRGYVMHGDRRVENQYFSVEAHARVNELSFILSAKYADDAMARLAEELLARLQLRTENHNATAPGFCIGPAVFADPLPTHINENITMFVGLPSHPDVGLTLFSIANANAAPGLLARAAEADRAAGTDEARRTTKLRSAKRDINGMAGEELAERFREHRSTTEFMFNWETRGNEGDLSKPYVSLEMQTSPRPGAEPADSTLHQDALLALWDRISSSIRLRDAGPPQSARR